MKTALGLLIVSAIYNVAHAASTAGAICKVAGDPFYTTFDGARLEFQGKCVYNFASYSVTDCDPCDDTPPETPVCEEFHVYVENTQTPHDETRAYTSMAHVDVANHRISLRENGRVLVDEQDRTNEIKETAIIVGSKQNIEVKKDENKVIVTVEDAFKLTWDARGPYGRHVLELQLICGEYKEKLKGICGNYDGVVGNDHTAKDSQLTSSDTEVGNSWVANAVSCL